MRGLPERLRALADAIRGLEWELPITAREDCLSSAEEIERLELRVSQLETECGHLQADLKECRDAARDIWSRYMTCMDVCDRDLERWPWLAAGEDDE